MAYTHRRDLNPEYKFINSDVIQLTDIDTDESLQLITSDSEGNFTWRGISRAPLDRNALQTTATNNKYSDLAKPWMSIPDEEWSGGRGNKNFTDDSTRFYDSKRAQTAFKGIYCAPLDHYSTGIRKAVTNCPQSLTFVTLKGKYSQKFHTDGSISIAEIYLHLRRRGNPDGSIKVSVSSNQDGSSALVEEEYQASDFTDTLAEFRKVNFIPYTLAANTDYYLVIERVSDDESNEDNMQLGVSTEQDNSFSCWHGKNNLIPYNHCVLFRIAEQQTDDIRYKFFTYQQLPFAVKQSVNGGTPSLWLNGDIGTVSSVSGAVITDSGKSWAVNAYAGARVGLVYQQGVENQVTCWKTIISNTATTLTLDSEFAGDLPENGTTYIINDTPFWKQISGHGLTGFVTDAHVIRDQVYLCQGDHIDIRRMSWQSGAFEFKTLTGVKAVFLRSVRDSQGLMLWRGQNDDALHNRSVSRARLIDFVNNNGADTFELCNITTAFDNDQPVLGSAVDFGRGDYDGMLYKATVGTFTSDKKTGKLVITLQGSFDGQAFVDVKNWQTFTSKGEMYMDCYCKYPYRRIKCTASGTNVSVNNVKVTTVAVPRFEEDVITLFDNYGKITGLFEYGSDSTKELWVMQEGMLSSVKKYEYSEAYTYTLDRINIDEFERTAEEWNASAFETSGVYLLWGWLNGIQRFYSSQVEGKGPDKDEGLPEDRRGRISKLLSYPSHFFCSVDAEGGYSQVLLFNTSGWHEIYRAPNQGERIHDMCFQPIYGPRPDKLWLQVGNDLVWLSMPSKTLEAVKDTEAEYSHEAVVVGSWMNAGMTDIVKLWQTMKLDTDFLEDGVTWVEADYQLDDDPTWYPVKNWYVTGPSQKEDLDESRSVLGKKLRYRLRLQTTDIHKTPRVNVVVIEAVGRIDIKYSYSFTARNIKYKPDLTGEFEDIEPLEVQEILDRWANELKKLRMNCRYKVFDDKLVYLDAVQTSNLKELQEGYILQINVNEL